MDRVPVISSLNKFHALYVDTVFNKNSYSPHLDSKETSVKKRKETTQNKPFDDDDDDDFIINPCDYGKVNDRFPHPTNKSLFVQCGYNHLYYVQTCPANTEFDEMKLECVFGFKRPPSPCNQNKCMNDGKCVEVNAVEYMCLCRTGFTGLDCSVNMDDCQMGVGCDKKDKCVDLINGYVCQRTVNDMEYLGVDSRNMFPSKCSKYDKLTILYYPIRDNRQFYYQCANGGRTIVKSCHSGLFWHSYSQTCQTDFPLVDLTCEDLRCNMNQFCHVDQKDNSAHCKCKSGYSGELCHRRDDHCQPNKCAESSRCISTVFGYNCLCHNSFLHLNCDEIKKMKNPCRKADFQSGKFMYSHPTNSTLFITCRADGTASIMSCAKNLVFDNDLKTCVLVDDYKHFEDDSKKILRSHQIRFPSNIVAFDEKLLKNSI
ncbi:hypothetical protein SNEBB_008541 [Seison nebaliae]|nr:hypothetical protein SNEBB_008541 [Seison nebaliae]